MQQWGQALETSQQGNVHIAKWGEALASQGRKGDTEIAHVTPGELVVPRDIINQNPQLRDIIAQAMSEYGADINQFTVGHHQQSINPATGQPEFGFFSSIGSFFKKLLSNPVIRTIASVAAGFVPGIGPALSAGVQGIGTKLAGGSWGQALGAAAGSYLGGKVGFGGETLKGATVGSTLGKVGSSIGAGSMTNTLVSALPSALSSAAISPLAGAYVGGNIGAAVGAAVDPPKQNWGTSQLQNSPSLTTPTGNLNAAAAAINGAGGPGGAGAGANIPINYISQVKNRDTGQMERVSTPDFTAGFNTNRRQGWGAGVSFA